jgi:enoyl-CoA hydratase/carnithine racemase
VRVEQQADAVIAYGDDEQLWAFRQAFEDNIAIIKFNRPNVLNALNTETILELEKDLDELAVNSAVRVIILTGEGKAFVAGADIFGDEQVFKHGSKSLYPERASGTGQT